MVGCSDDAAAPTLGIPCDVQAVLDAKCLRCHGTPLELDAPYALTELEQFHEAIGELHVYDIVKRTIEDEYMPPVVIQADPPIEPLTADEKATALGWLDAGARAADRTTCD